MLCHGEHNPNNMFLLSKDKKDLINFCGGQCFAPLGKSSFFFHFLPFILPKEQMIKRQQVDLLLGQNRMEGKERKIIGWQGSYAL